MAAAAVAGLVTAFHVESIVYFFSFSFSLHDKIRSTERTFDA